METLRLYAAALLLLLVGGAYLSLLGVATQRWLLPRRWLPLAPVTAPLVGWAVLVAVGYPLNCALPIQWVAWLLGAVALLTIALDTRRSGLGRAGHLWARRALWAEAAWPLACAVATYAAAMAAPIRQGTLSSVIADSDVEHFADVVAALVHFPIGFSVRAQQGLEATPVGLAYHYVHASLTALTGLDTFTTAQPSHALLLALGVLSVYVFACQSMRLRRRPASLAAMLFALGGVLPLVAAFGWGQQTAAAVAMPFGVAALDAALRRSDRRAVLLAGLAGALAADALYLASAPLVGGCAVVIAVAVAARRRDFGGVARRLVAIGALVAVAGLFSHVSAVAYLLNGLHGGGLSAADVSGRSTHVSTFAPLPAALGLAPFDFARAVTDQRGHDVLAWSAPPLVWGGRAAAALALGLAVAGAIALARRGRWSALGVLASAGAFEVYVRVLRPFPYGEFKLLTTIWFLVPALAVAGAESLTQWSSKFKVQGSRGWRLRHWQRVRQCRVGRAASWGAYGALALAALGLGFNRVHTEGLLSLPYGAALPEREMAAARAIAAATPRGASVYVSGQLAPEAVYSPAPLVTPNRGGFPSQYVRTDYLSRRWRGVVTSLLAFEGRPVYGLVTRHSTELRQPVEPKAADYVLLDETEDPRLYGALPADLARAAGRLRLYRNQHAPAALLNAIRGAEGQRAVNVAFDGRTLTVGGTPVPAAEPLPAPVLPVGDSLPGWGRTVAPPRRITTTTAEAAPAGTRGHLVVGVQALQPTYLRVDLGGPGSADESRMTAVEPGLTWYTSPALTWPAGLTLTPQNPAVVRLLAAIVDQRDAVAESLDRSTAGTDWPLLTATARAKPSGGLALDVWYSYAGPREGPYRTVLRDAPRLWETGPGLPVALHPGPGERTWTADLQPGAVVAQQASDGRQPPRPNQLWTPDTGEQWIWFELGPDGDASLHSVPVAKIEVNGGLVGVRTAPAGVAVLPLLAEPVPPPRVEDGTLVKGSGDAVYYVDHGRLRWVPSPDILQRMGIVWRLTSLSDLELERLPVGLPLG